MTPAALNSPLVAAGTLERAGLIFHPLADARSPEERPAVLVRDVASRLSHLAQALLAFDLPLGTGRLLLGRATRLFVRVRTAERFVRVVRQVAAILLAAIPAERRAVDVAAAVVHQPEVADPDRLAVDDDIQRDGLERVAASELGIAGDAALIVQNRRGEIALLAQIHELLPGLRLLRHVLRAGARLLEFLELLLPHELHHVLRLGQRELTVEVLEAADDDVADLLREEGVLLLGPPEAVPLAVVLEPGAGSLGHPVAVLPHLLQLFSRQRSVPESLPIRLVCLRSPIGFLSLIATRAVHGASKKWDP